MCACVRERVRERERERARERQREREREREGEREFCNNLAKFLQYCKPECCAKGQGTDFNLKVKVMLKSTLFVHSTSSEPLDFLLPNFVHR